MFESRKMLKDRIRFLMDERSELILQRAMLIKELEARKAEMERPSCDFTKGLFAGYKIALETAKKCFGLENGKTENFSKENVVHFRKDKR